MGELPGALRVGLTKWLVGMVTTFLPTVGFRLVIVDRALIRHGEAYLIDVSRLMKLLPGEDVFGRS